MTAAPSPRCERLVEFSQNQLRARLGEALALYVRAMRYPSGAVQHRAPMWLSHMLRAQWRCVGALAVDGSLVGIGYGYQGAPGQWWYEQVRRGLSAMASPLVDEWMNDYFELTELHVRPDAQGHGLGEVINPLPREVPVVDPKQAPHAAVRECGPALDLSHQVVPM